MRQRSYGTDTELTLRLMFTMFMLGIVWMVFMGLLFGACSQNFCKHFCVYCPGSNRIDLYVKLFYFFCKSIRKSYYCCF